MGEGAGTIVLKNRRSSFENLRASPELDEGTNGEVIESIGGAEEVN
jgi:hypothetical protein